MIEIQQLLPTASRQIGVPWRNLFFILAVKGRILNLFIHLVVLCIIYLDSMVAFLII